MKNILIIILFCSLIIACNNGNKNKITGNKSVKIKNKQTTKVKFESTNNKANYYVGDSLKFTVSQTNNVPFDSVRFFVNNMYLTSTNSLPIQLQLDSIINTLGQLQVEARIFADSSQVIRKHYFTFLSDIEPKIYSYKVIKSYPHDKRAFTQGLIFENGYLYEATGLKGESSIRKVQIATGDVLQAITIDPKIFGEGITIFNNKIIQLSWTSQIGFVYDKNSFKQVGSFNYPTEGWGLTNNKQKLIMSDGSNKLHFLDTETYTELGRIEVYDNKTAVNELNELEFINGDVYANVYRTNKIAIIDINTGKVKAYIDLSGILDQKFYTSETGVLNGIAYDAVNKRLFVTGKKWPKLFEIKLLLITNEVNYE